jgi:hypothetical protein
MSYLIINMIGEEKERVRRRRASLMRVGVGLE